MCKSSLPTVFQFCLHKQSSAIVYFENSNLNPNPNLKKINQLFIMQTNSKNQARTFVILVSLAMPRS